MSFQVGKIDDKSFTVTEVSTVSTQKSSDNFSIELDRALLDLARLKIRQALELSSLNQRIADLQDIKKQATDIGVIFSVAANAGVVPIKPVQKG